MRDNETKSLSLIEILDRLPNYNIKKDKYGERIDVMYGGEVHLYMAKNDETIFDASVKALDDFNNFKE